MQRIIDQTGMLLRYGAFAAFAIVGFLVFFFAPGEIKSLPTLISILLGLGISTFTIWFALSNFRLETANWENQVTPNAKKLFWGIVILGIILRVGWSLIYPPVQLSNYEKYWKLAIQFAETSRYFENFQGHTLYAYRPPGYPVLLGLFMKVLGPHPWITVLTNTIFYILTSMIVYRLSLKIGGYLSALVASFILAVWPTYFTFVPLSATEYIFMLIMIGIIWLFDRAHTSGWKDAAFAGILTGFGTLIRANLMVFPFFWFLYSLMNRKDFAKGVQLTVIGTVFMVLTIAPWSARNYSIFDTFVAVSTNGGSNFYRSNNPLATGTYTARGEKDLDQYLNDELLWNKTGYDWGKEWVQENPDKFLMLSANKLRIFMGQDNTGVKWSMKAHGKKKGLFYELLSAGSTLWWILVWFLVLIALIRWRDYFTGSALGATLLYSVLFLVVIHSVFESQPRYHMPIMAALSIIAALNFSPQKGQYDEAAE